MLKQTSKPDYSKMNEAELRELLKKHQQMLSNTRIVNALPDKGERLRKAIVDIEDFLTVPSLPMDCDAVANQFSQMTMSPAEKEIAETKVYLEKAPREPAKTTDEKDFSDERLNEVKQRLKARQAERDSKATVSTVKLISLDEAVRLHNEEKKRNEEHLIQQTTARLLGNMSLSKTTFGLPPASCKTSFTYRKTAVENGDDEDEDNDVDDHGRDRAEILSDHDSDEVDYPDDDDEAVKKDDD